MAAQDIEYPGGQDGPLQGLAVWDLQGGRPGDADDKRVAGSWPALVEAISTSGRADGADLRRVAQPVVGQAGPAGCARSFPDSRAARDRDGPRPRAGRRLRLAGGDQERPDLDLGASSSSGIRDPDRLATNPARGLLEPAGRRQGVRAVGGGSARRAGSTWSRCRTPRRRRRSCSSRFASVVGFDPDTLHRGAGLGERDRGCRRDRGASGGSTSGWREG